MRLGIRTKSGSGARPKAKAELKIKARPGIKSGSGVEAKTDSRVIVQEKTLKIGVGKPLLLIEAPKGLLIRLLLSRVYRRVSIRATTKSKVWYYFDY